MSNDLALDIQEWEGGSVAVWGAVAPIYNTTALKVANGVHVHARRNLGGDKEIDDTFDRVVIRNWGPDEKPLVVNAVEAIHYMVTAIFGLRPRRILCPACKQPHLDEGWFSVKPHRKHLCAYCQRVFFDVERGIGNPIGEVERLPDALVMRTPLVVSAEFQQTDYPGGMQLWGSNPAMYWRSQNRENHGIHLHAFDAGGNIVYDETVTSLTIDGISLDAEMVRTYMAQSVVPQLAQSVSDISCPRCGAHHFDHGPLAHTPHVMHTCERCRKRFKHGQGQLSIGNPIVGTLTRLREMAA